VQRHHDGEVLLAVFHAAATQQLGRVPPGYHQLGQPLEDDDDKQRPVDDQQVPLVGRPVTTAAAPARR
jgi:hypothetical protein